MIVELLGTGGVGKSTLEPLIAARLGIGLYAGGKRQDIDARDLPPWQVWRSRFSAISTNPVLFAGAYRRVPSSMRHRAWFAMDICRREQNARRAERRGEGVLASGPLHALGQGSARFNADLSRLATRITTADLYVWLRLDPDMAAQRLADRRKVGLERIGDHRGWTTRYENVTESALALVAAPVVEVDATGPVEEVVNLAVGQIRSALTG